MESKIAKTEIVLVKLDCSDGKTRSFSCPINVSMDRVDGMYVSQVSAVAAINDDTNVYSVHTDLTGCYLTLVNDHQATPNTYFKMSGQTINGNYTFRVEPIGSDPTEMHYVIGILLTFVKFS